jgi:ABC-type lipoprotein release transport system permease subunit
MIRFIRFLASKIRNFAVVAKISFRNLVRQFRRNLLLGICIAVSICVLIVTMSFTNGMTDIIFNKIMVYMTGHIRVQEYEYTSRRSDVIRDKQRFKDAIVKSVDGIKSIDEDVSAFGRILGNGKTGMVALVGIAKDADFYTDTMLEEGSPKDMFKKDVFPGIILYKNAAKDLNVRMNDVVTVRFETVYGQAQAPKFKVVGLIPSENMFMDVAAFVDMETLRGLLNMKPNECQGFNIVVKYPGDTKKVIAEANKLYDELAPGAAGVKAELSAGHRRAAADVFALKLSTDPVALKIATDDLRFVQGGIQALALEKDGVVLTEPLARSLGAGFGTRIVYRYAPKNSPEQPVEAELVVKGVVKPVAGFEDSTAFAHEDAFYKTYFWNIPERPAAASRDAPLSKALLMEWDRLERSPTTDDYRKKMQRLNRDTWKGARLDVMTMYETASAMIDFQKGLNIVSLVAVLVLFFVILIGVVNTMRMSIRERTREIGTNRAIGMQRSDVRSVFVLEILFLAAVSCVVGILAAYGLMAALSTLTFDLKDNPFSMFFVKKHLYFVPTAATVIVNFVIITAVAYFIAFFTARRAAKLRVADALRHYE